MANPAAVPGIHNLTAPRAGYTSHFKKTNRTSAGLATAGRSEIRVQAEKIASCGVATEIKAGVNDTHRSQMQVGVDSKKMIRKSLNEVGSRYQLISMRNLTETDQKAYTTLPEIGSPSPPIKTRSPPIASDRPIQHARKRMDSTFKECIGKMRDSIKW